MARSRSRKTLGERRAEAEDLFTKGFTVADVARRLGVTWDTAKGYKEWHEKRVAEKVAESPQLLQDVIGNTVRSIAECDQVRSRAWKTYHTSIDNDTRMKALTLAQKCSQDKARLLGLLGVKHEFYARVQVVNAIQTRLIEFLRSEICDTDRRKIETFLTSPEIQRFMTAELPVLELDAGDYEEVAS